MDIKIPKSRYSAAELFGHNMQNISLDLLREISKDSIQQICPYKTSSDKAGSPLCSKAGGVCSIRPYVMSAEGASAIPAGQPTITCPIRFLENGDIYRWIGDVLLQTPNPLVVPEIPFLMGNYDAEEDSGDAVGKIDMVLVNAEEPALKWCALEMQAVYFSGGSMGNDRRLWASWYGPNLPFPPVIRRPDFRSSGPKRLMPQLQVKVPTIARWGKKMAVVVDSEFWASLRNIRETKDVSNCDIAWFIVRLDFCQQTNQLKLVKDSVHFTTLTDAVEGLTGGVPLSLEKFETLLIQKLKRMESN